MTESGFPVASVGDAAVVTAPVEIDPAEAELLRKSLIIAVETSAIVVVDLTGTEYCGSSGISALIVARKHAQARGGEIRLAMSQEAVRRIFRITGADSLFRIFGSAEEAVAADAAAPQASLLTDP